MRLASLSWFACAALASSSHATQAPLVVHEWGTFTAVSGEDGRAEAWRALVQPWELPRFVHRDEAPSLPAIHQQPAGRKAALRGLVRLETPVTYFYTAQPMRLSVRVDFPAGQLTEWYPTAQRQARRLHWRDLEVRPGAAVTLPEDGSPSHYYAARVAEAAPVSVIGAGGVETEGFLFYRGVGQWTPPLLAQLDGEAIRLTPLGPAVGRALVFEAADDRTAWRSVDLSRGSARVRRPRGGDAALAREALRSLLLEGGLFPEEAEAMLDTWDSSWFEEGLRVFFVLPPSLVDEMLPLRIRPVPSELRRVFVGRIEVVTPERLRWAEERLSAVPESTPSETLSALGRFADPLLRRLQKTSSDPAIRRLCEEALALP